MAWVVLLLLNVPFLLAHPAWPVVSAALPRSLLINLVIFVNPGLAIVAALRAAGWLQRWHVLWVVTASLALFVATIVVARFLHVTPTAPLAWNCAWLCTNAAALFAWALRRETVAVALPPNWRAALAVFAASYALFFWAGTRVVPYQGDHDMDLQATAHGLVTELRPAYPTPRSYYYLAHPPLLHVFVAGSFLYHGQLDGVSVYDPKAADALPQEAHWRYYTEHPFLLETRTPNIFLSSLTVALLAMWLTTATGGTRYALLLALAYATLPEVFVRSSYGGYFAGSKFFALQMLWAIEAWAGPKPGDARWRAGLSGAMSAWANHKLVILPLALCLWRVVNIPLKAGVKRIGTHLFHPVAVGFLVGTLSFWAYGWWVSPTDFWNDHIHHHIVDRITNTNARGLNMAAYPTLEALWLEFWRDTSYLMLPLGIFSLGALLFSRPANNSGDRSTWSGWSGLAGLWTIWALIAAVAFSLIDWKQTKHLTALIVPMTLAPAVALGDGRLPRRVATITLWIVVALNVWVIYTLAQDFHSLVKVPEW